MPFKTSMAWFSVVGWTFAVVFVATYALTQAAPAPLEVVNQGAYSARAGDCIGCHTAQKGQPFAGGAPFAIPVGKVYSTNITPDSVTGIGRYDINDFVKVMHKGIAKDGHHLFPAMPYPSYARVSQEDLSALYAFFMQDVKPLHNVNRPAELNWPLGMRSLMSVWNALYLKKGEYSAEPGKSASWNRGAYLVQGLGHCGDCHSPRGIAGHVLATSERDRRHFLAGATMENWHASPLSGDAGTGLYAWSKEDIAEFLKTGRTARVGAVGMMAEVVGKSTQYLTDEDLISIAEYLKSLPASIDESRVKKDSVRQAKCINRAAGSITRGLSVYLDNCNACHGSNGTGASRIFPSLVKNEAVNSPDPVSLVHIVLTGSSMPSTQTAPSSPAMPGFGWRLTDEQTADVLTFVRNSWGNHAAPVGRIEVGRLRKAIVTTPE